MTPYLVAIRHPNDYDPSLKGEAMGRDIHALNVALVAAHDRGFVGGPQWAPRSAKSLGVQPGGDVLITDGPCLDTEGHVAGLRCLNPPTWTRCWPGDARSPSPVGRRSSCERLADGGPSKAIERHRRSADRSSLRSGVRPHRGARGSVGSSRRLWVRRWPARSNCCGSIERIERHN